MTQSRWEIQKLRKPDKKQAFYQFLKHHYQFLYILQTHFQYLNAEFPIEGKVS